MLNTNFRTVFSNLQSQCMEPLSGWNKEIVVSHPMYKHSRLFQVGTKVFTETLLRGRFNFSATVTLSVS